MVRAEVKNEEPLKKAIEVYGEESQLLMAVEELSELMNELLHYRRKRPQNIAEEMADVYIMLRQMQIIFNNSIEVQEWIDRKILRLDEQMDEDYS